MCGQSGAIGSLSGKEELVALDLMYMNALRGGDSSGLAVLKRNEKKVDTPIKCLGPSYLLEDHKHYNKLIGGSNTMFMSHSRSATIGATTLSNAHPHRFEHIVGTHNGTVPLVEVRDLPDGKDAKSDSWTILNSMDVQGIEATIGNIYYGAWALVWYDSRDKTINFLRNDQRTLYYAFDEDRKNLFWSSEVEMLASAINRRGVKRGADNKCKVFVHDMWYKFKVPEYNKPFEDEIRTKVESKKWANYHSSKTYSGGNNSDDRRPFPLTQNTTGTTGTSFTNSENSSNNNIVPFKKDDKTTSVSAERSESAHIAAIKQMVGKDRFQLIYRNRRVNLYVDTNNLHFHRYWWDASGRRWNHYESEWDSPSAEIKGKDVVDILKRKVNWVGLSEHPPKSEPIEIKDKDTCTEHVRFRSNDLVITKKKDSSDKKPWVEYTWKHDLNGGSGRWIRVEYTYPPGSLPDLQRDIHADHGFKWHGKREKRRVMIKGFNRKELDMEEFNKITSCGCIGCGRTPKWNPGRFGGVKVCFIDDKTFLCEYCVEDRDTYERLKLISGNIKTAVAAINQPTETTVH